MLLATLIRDNCALRDYNVIRSISAMGHTQQTNQTFSMVASHIEH